MGADSPHAQVVWCDDHRAHHVVMNAHYPDAGGVDVVVRHRGPLRAGWSLHNYTTCPCRTVVLIGQAAVYGDAVLAAWLLVGDVALDQPQLGFYGPF